jgi:hypothetical protein
LEEDYLYERLYEGLKMEGASNFTEFESSKRGFGENGRFTELMKRSISLKGSEGLLKGSRHDLIG